MTSGSDKEKRCRSRSRDRMCDPREQSELLPCSSRTHSPPAPKSLRQRSPNFHSREGRKERPKYLQEGKVGHISAKLRDPNLPELDDDPRDKEVHGKVMTGFKGGGRNTESFDPMSTLVRPDMRVIVGPCSETIGRRIKHDDIIVVPEFLCKEDDWTLYYKLVEEMREVQAKGEKSSEWISWHEGAHLISKNPNGSKSYRMIQDKISKYFNIPPKSVGTRFNWYKDSSDWKPFHHDSAAFNAQRARNQNITVGVSLGATRELAFLHAKNGTKVYFPQTNGMMFSFGRDVNIQWKHGVNALPSDGHDGRGRVSIILWGMCGCVDDEGGSPPMLTDNTRGNGHSIHMRRDAHGGDRKGERDRDRDRETDRERDREREQERDKDRYRERKNDRERETDRDRERERENDRDRDRKRERENERERARDRDRERDRDKNRDREKERERRRNSNDEHSGTEKYQGGSREACRDFGRGTCRHGDRCRYSHDDH